MKKSVLILSIVILSVFITISCSNNSSESETIDPSISLYKEVLTNNSLNVITETYKDLYNKSVLLKNAVNTLTIGDEAKLTAVKNAWVSSRSPWEKSEGFLYGPVDTEGIDPAIDSWPVNVNDINNILSSNTKITSSLLETNNEARGFHTIEFFIWGINGNKTAAQLTAREIEYLKAATINFEEKTYALYNAWRPTGDNFADNFINPGSTRFVKSQKEGLNEFAEGLVIIADEVANTKIEVPLNGNNGSAKPEEEESRFSNNSKLDFADNIRSIQNIYLGDYNGINGKGLSDIVAQKNAALDTEIKTKITTAITAIEAIPGTFTAAITNNRVAVQNAQTKVAELKVILETKLVPLISNL